MVRYLLDSNIISEPAKPDPDDRVQDNYRRHEHEAATSSVVWHELLYGAWRLPQGRRRRYLAYYLSEVVAPGLPILEYDAASARRHAAERARLERAGKTPPFRDGMIAATAIVGNLILVTRNTHDFESFEGLQLENWFED